MPNWCMNEIAIKGDKSELKKFADKSKGKDLSLKTYYPEPNYEEIEVPEAFPHIPGSSRVGGIGESRIGEPSGTSVTLKVKSGKSVETDTRLTHSATSFISTQRGLLRRLRSSKSAKTSQN